MATKKILELLAPAKDLACGHAAISHGADAIYIGGPKFGAREDAGNSVQDIGTLANEAHIFGAKVYAALNTILYDNELEEAQRLIKNLYEAGVDALIVQDLGILEMDLPPIPLHASTQLHNYRPEQVRFLEAVNFKRAVLARELSLDQVREIRGQTTIELEVFVHGSLCVSFSGHCYLSHAIGGRSANRGACAQPCRKRYTLYDADNKVIAADRHFLSLKDLNLSDSIGDLAGAGIQSFKIEGRLKGIDYVKNITSYYRKKIDAFLEDKPEYKAASAGKIYYGFDADPTKTFNRGTTDYFLNGRSDRIASFESPKFLGEAAGAVKRVAEKFFELETDLEISNNDGLVFISKNGESIGIKVNVAERGRIFPDKMNGIFVGAKVFRNYDHRFQLQLKDDLTVRKIGVNLAFIELSDGFELVAQDETGTEVAIDIEMPKNPARDPQKSKEAIIRQLSKSGDTHYLVNVVETNDVERYFFQASFLNGTRRNLLDQLTVARLAIKNETVVNRPNDFPYPTGQVGFEANISNWLAVRFYQRHGVENPAMAFEKRPKGKGQTVMTMKHCLKFQMGFCPKFGGSKPIDFTEPFFLDDGDNWLKLDFDCQQCVMKLAY